MQKIHANKLPCDWHDIIDNFLAVTDKLDITSWEDRDDN
jgi:hypothetical protein